MTIRADGAIPIKGQEFTSGVEKKKTDPKDFLAKMLEVEGKKKGEALQDEVGKKKIDEKKKTEPNMEYSQLQKGNKKKIDVPHSKKLHNKGAEKIQREPIVVSAASSSEETNVQAMDYSNKRLDIRDSSINVNKFKNVLVERAGKKDTVDPSKIDQNKPPYKKKFPPYIPD